MYKPSTPNDHYPPYETGKELGVFLKKDDGEEYEGQVWGGLTVWPDWTHPDTGEWWSKWISHFKSIVDFDGLWLDMNEPANLPVATDQWLSTKSVVEVDGKMFVDLGQNKWDFPPYAVSLNSP